MSKEKISSQEIIDLLAAQTNISKRQAEDFIKAMFGIIEERLVVGETVKIKNLGTFKSQWNESRKSVNVNTGEEFVIPGFRKITFAPESILKETVNEPYAHLQAIEIDSNALEDINNDELVDNDEELDLVSSEQVVEITDTNEVLGILDTEDVIEAKKVIENLEADEVIEAKKVIENLEADETFELEEIKEVLNVVDNKEDIEVEDIKEIIKVAEPIENKELIEETEFKDDLQDIQPLNVLTEQALEIKNLLSEIQGLSFKNESVKINLEEPIQSVEAEVSAENELVNAEPEVPTINIFDRINEEMRNVTENVSKPSILNNSVELKNVADEEIVLAPLSEEKEIITVESSQVEHDKNSIFEVQNAHETRNDNSTDINDSKDSDLLITNSVDNEEDTNFIDNEFVEKKKRSKWWLYLLLFLLLVIVGCIGTYFLSSATRCWVKYELFSEKNMNKSENLKQNFLNFFGMGTSEVVTKPKEIVKDSIITPKIKVDSVKIDSVPVVQKKDTVVDVLNKKRTFNETIATEKFGKGNTLTNLSLKYYGHKDFWVYIYEANKAEIKNPDNIEVGKSIRIPKLDPGLIDLKNPNCLKKAKELHDLYVKK